MVGNKIKNKEQRAVLGRLEKQWTILYLIAYN